MAPDDSSDPESLMKNADLAMYQAKEKGRNAAQFYTTDMNFEVENRLNLERELRSAIKNHQFELYYQPQIDFRTGEIVGAEALMRWHHPKRGLVSPLDFIPVAEDSGLIVPMGRWALYQACQQARNIHKALGRAIRISVNVSARQLRDDGFIVDVEHALKESRLEPRWLELEITESALMAQGDKAIERLAQLRSMGVNLAIDDFGTGYSSLSHLKRLPVTRLKVDRSFVKDLPDDEEDRAITSLIVAMANSLYYEVVVEGVEIQSQLVFLARCGCDYVQGFYFSRPVPADELLVLLFDWKPDSALGQIFI
jgi:EAL domain-containing protein (putative c-di-GMP-specific phosphodiesterase class I)